MTAVTLPVFKWAVFSVLAKTLHAQIIGCSRTQETEAARGPSLADETSGQVFLILPW